MKYLPLLFLFIIGCTEPTVEVSKYSDKFKQGDTLNIVGEKDFETIVSGNSAAFLTQSATGQFFVRSKKALTEQTTILRTYVPKVGVVTKDCQTNCIEKCKKIDKCGKH